MIFPVFSLAEQIGLYNTQNGTQFTDEETFGFDYFNPSLLAHHVSLIKSINDGFNLFLFDENEKQFNALKNEALRAGITALAMVGKKGSAKANTFVPYTTEEIKSNNESLQLKDNWHNWLRLQSEVLDGESIWLNNEVFDAETLKLQWQKQRQLARWNDSAIYHIASDILPSLIKYTKRARKSLYIKKHNIPDEIYKAYCDYLKDFEAKTKAFQTMLAESMFARLRAFDESKYTYTNPILHITNKLKPAQKKPKQPYPIKNGEFTFYHSYINRHGSKQTKKNLQKLSWVEGKASLSFPTCAIETKDSEVIVVPRILADEIPTERKWPNWLFKGSNLRHEFFKNSLLLMTHLKKDINVKEHYIDIKEMNSYLPLLDGIRQKEALVNQNYNKLKSSSVGDLPFFYFSTKSFFKKWQNILTDQKLKLIEDKLLIAEELIKGIHDDSYNTQVEPNLPWTACKHLYELSVELKQHTQTDNLSDAVKTRIASVMATTGQFASVNKAFELSIKLANHELITHPQLQYLASYIGRLSSKNETSFNSFKEYLRPQTELTLTHLINELKRDPFKLKSDSDLESHQNYICCSISMLEKLGIDEEKSKIEKQAKKYFLRYLQNILNNDYVNNEKFVNHIAIAEEVIKTVGSLAKWCNKSLYEYIEELNAIKKNVENEKLYKIKCKALLLSLSQHFLKNHLDKELQEFDEALFGTLKDEPHNYEDANINVLNNIRDSMVRTGRPLEVVVSSPSEKGIVGINSSENSHVQDLLKLSAHAHHVKEVVSSNDTPILKKPEEVKKLSEAVSQFFANPMNGFYPDHLRKKPWFKKQYIDTTVLEPSSPNTKRI